MATRKEILEMLSRGEIDVTRATELLNAAGQPPEDPTPPPAPPDPVKPKRVETPAKRKNGQRWLHIHVSDLDDGRARVRVNVPLGLVNFGLKVGARFTNELNDNLIGDVMELLQDNELTGTLVEVEDVEDNERVHIYID